MAIAQNLASVRERLSKAALRSGRNSADITLVAVTKYSTAEEVLEAAACGQRIFAENRVQMLQEKWKRLEELQAAGTEIPELHWHLIGHLQTNKVKYVVGKVELIHSVDSLRLAEEIERCGAKKNVVSDILLEVNVSGEESKSGLSTSEIEPLIAAASALPHVRIRGLMTMAPKGAPEAELREIFSSLYKIFLDKRWSILYHIDMTYLSMGMSADFECAIEEGANMIRVGHGIFL